MTYLALLDLVEMAIDQVTFGDFSFSYLDRKKLGALLREDVRCLFYPERTVGIERFANHYYLVAHRERPSGISGMFDEVDYSFFTVSSRPTRMARPVEKGLRILALYNWQPVWTEDDDSSKTKMRSGWPGLTVPAVIAVTDDLFDTPQWFPPSSEVLMTNPRLLGRRKLSPRQNLVDMTALGLERWIVEVALDHIRVFEHFRHIGWK